MAVPVRPVPVDEGMGRFHPWVEHKQLPQLLIADAGFLRDVEELLAEGNLHGEVRILHVLRKLRRSGVGDAKAVRAVINALENLNHTHAGVLLPAEDGERKAEVVTVLGAAVVLRAEDDGLARLPRKRLRRARQHRALYHEHVGIVLRDRSTNFSNVTVLLLLTHIVIN